MQAATKAGTGSLFSCPGGLRAVGRSSHDSPCSVNDSQQRLLVFFRFCLIAREGNGPRLKACLAATGRARSSSSSRARPRRVSACQMAHPPSVFTGAARPCGHKTVTSSPVRTPRLLGLAGRGVFCHLGFALKHPPDPLHPWDVRRSEGQHGCWVGGDKQALAAGATGEARRGRAE